MNYSGASHNVQIRKFKKILQNFMLKIITSKCNLV